MKLRGLAAFAAILTISMFAVSAWAWGQVPEDAQIPIHWGLDGTPDGYGPKWVGLLLTPALGAFLGVMFIVIPRFDPRREHLAASAQAWIAIGASTMLLLAAVHVAIVAAVLGAGIDMGRMIGIGVGAMLLIIGNYLGKTRSNWFMGVRTPWTLSSERSWTITHRLAGRLFMAVGLVSILVGLVASAQAVFFTLLPGLGVVVVIVVVYSYIVWRDDPDRRAP